MSKFPLFSQWKQIFKVLKKSEIIALLLFVILAAGSATFLISDLYLSSTKAVPALGGTYTEGIVGQPRFINPIYGETNDTDRTFIDLVFSGLMTYDNNGKLVTDLAESYTISPDGKTYDFILKDNIFWHDGKPLAVDDIIFTIKTIQTSDYKSPLRANWIDVSMQKISDKELTFSLKAPYNSFLENLTARILPKHIWENISPENFTISSYNLQPIGSGPFQFSSLSQASGGFIKSISLESNRRYYKPASFIANLSFQFFENKNDLLKAASAGQINGFTLASVENNQTEALKSINRGWFKKEHFSTYSFSLPRYFAVFFNTKKTSLFSDVNLRQGLSHAVNKEELVKNINGQTQDNITQVNSPILPDFFGYQTSPSPYNFDTAKANALLDKTGFKTNASGQRSKDTTKTPAFQFKAYLKVGSKGNEVRELQACLTKLDVVFKNLLVDETTGTYGKATENAVTEFQKKYLPDLKPTGETGASTKAKLNELCLPASSNTQLLTFTLVTINQPQLVAIANALKEYWQKVGVSVTVDAVAATDIKNIIKNRNYDALLYGEALGALPDLYPFWHSSQKLDPGLNLSSYENKKVDQLLQDARQTTDNSLKQQKYEQLQTLIINDAPALFLYNPDYIYWVSDKVSGIDTSKIIDPAKRFSNITNWFLKTKRVFK